MKLNKRIFIFTILLLIFGASSNAFELDTSIDDEIRKNYNPSKLENDTLPDLPNTLKNATGVKAKPDYTQKTITTAPTAVPNTNIDTDFSGSNKVIKSNITSNISSNFEAIKIKKGTKFKVKSQTKVSDWNTAGARMTFVSVEPVTARYVSFPIGTTFKAVVEDSHQPNFGGNGGLLKIKADTLIQGNTSQNMDAKIIKADGKKIFFNNIKGKRGYVSGLCKNVGKGERFYKKSRQMSNRWSSNPVGTILSPLPTIVGVVGYTANLLVSPVTSLWSKGSHITIPSCANYTIKLRQDLYLSK
jgi:hypothetical protein